MQEQNKAPETQETEKSNPETASAETVEPMTTENATEANKQPQEDSKEKGTKKADKKAKAELALCKEALVNAEKELAEEKDKYMRMAAEYDNFRRRSQKEKETIYGDAVNDTVTLLLGILDNLERASLYTDAEKVADGLALTAKSAESIFAKLNITSFGLAGDAFDPNIHNAIMHIEDEAFGENEIVEVLQKGYRKGDKIIRFALVKVAN